MYGDVSQRKRVIRVNRVENPPETFRFFVCCTPELFHLLVNRNTIPARQHVWLL